MKQSMFKSKDELPMFLTVMDIANLLDISHASAYELVREDNFPKLKIVQGRTIIPRDMNILRFFCIFLRTMLP